MMKASELLACPFCGSQPIFDRGKKGHCQLHGEPFQAVVIRCKQHGCPAKPSVSAGNIYNGGEAKARAEAATRWNSRPTPPEQPTQPWKCPDCGNAARFNHQGCSVAEQPTSGEAGE